MGINQRQRRRKAQACLLVGRQVGREEGPRAGRTLEANRKILVSPSPQSLSVLSPGGRLGSACACALPEGHACKKAGKAKHDR